MKEYYMLLGLNSKKVKITKVEDVNGIIEVNVINSKNKVRCGQRIVILNIFCLFYLFHGILIIDS